MQSVLFRQVYWSHWPLNATRWHLSVCQNICTEQHWASLCVPGAGGHELLEYVLVVDYTMLRYRSKSRSILVHLGEFGWLRRSVGQWSFVKKTLNIVFDDSCYAWY